jgi:hypothetical protein
MIEHSGIFWQVHSPSLYVHDHGGVDILCGCNGRTWQLGIGDQYRDRCFDSRDEAMAAYARGAETARQAVDDLTLNWSPPA